MICVNGRVAFVEAGNSCNEADYHFVTSVSFAVNLMTLYRATGSVKPRPVGGKRHGKLDASEVFLKAFEMRRPDVTMPELAAALLDEKGVDVAAQSLSRWLIKKGFSFKKNTSGKRARQTLSTRPEPTQR